ncbi:MAG: hypothetical protein J6K04_10170 [Lachnospiraceae bacterium]|nr:hypothetical protein [Lachnospiraceae bacterium]
MQLSSKEEQRYGRNKETVINRAYIESGEYRKKFDRISNNAELNKLLYQLAKKMLLHRSGTLYEDMYWIDPDVLCVVASEINCDMEQRIVYSHATIKAIRGKKGLLTIHSHPNSFPPSLADFNSNYEHHNGIGIVCGHDGSVYVYRAEEEIKQQDWTVEYHANYKRYKNERDAQEQVWRNLLEKYNAYLKEM